MSKHIGLRYRYMREKVISGEIRLAYLRTEEKLSDMLTKALVTKKFAEAMMKNVAEPGSEKPHARVG